MNEFEVGDLVKLKSGGMDLTIETVDWAGLEDNKVIVVYQNSKKEICLHTLPKGSLVKVEDD